MKNSTQQICSLILNAKTFFEKHKNVKDIHRNLGPVPLQRSQEYSKRHYKRIYNDIENGFYSYKDLVAYISLFYIWEDKLNLKEITDESVKGCATVFSNDRYLDDCKIIEGALTLFDTSAASHMNYVSLFEPNELGTSYIYEFIIKGVISPIFFIKNFDIFQNNRNSKKESKEYSDFIKKISYIKTYI